MRRTDGAAGDPARAAARLTRLASSALHPMARRAERVRRIEAGVTRCPAAAVNACPTQRAAERTVRGASEAAAEDLGTCRQRSHQQHAGYDLQHVAIDVHV